MQMGNGMNKNCLKQLTFTGNWFIDAGILGFVNLMEEVYGWDLNSLQEKIKENEKSVYCGYFPIAYVHYNNHQQNPFLNESSLPKFDNLSEEEIFERAWKFIEDGYKVRRGNQERIDITFSGPFVIFTNFLFFQPRWDINKQKEAFMEILGLQSVEEDTLKYIDKTINKFLPSIKEFNNLSYTQSFITLETLLSFRSYSLIFTLSFPLAFIRGVLSENIFFYSPNLEFTYKVNKKLPLLLRKLEDKSEIFQITWRMIIDSAIETQSLWTLENMYLIKYQLGGRQDIVSADYIGIPKLQASILLDDYIREILNTSLQIRGKNFKGNKNIWLLEEFIKGKPLYPLALQHVKLRLSGDIKKLNYSIFYALLIDAAISEFRRKEKETLFSKSFFQTNYKEILKKIKNEFRSIHYYSTNETKRLIRDKERERVAYLLLDSLYGNDKSRFLNILLKTLNNSDEIINPGFLNLIFKKIINNDKTWQNYALFITAGMVS